MTSDDNHNRDLESRLAQLSPQQRALFEQMAAQQAEQSARREAIQSRGAADGNPVSFAEHRLWVVSQIEPDNPFYNMPLAARLQGELCVDTLVLALRRVAERHEAFRTTYHLASESTPPDNSATHPHSQDGVEPRLPQRRIVDDAPAWPVAQVDARQWSESDLHRQLREDARRSFVLERGPLMRCHIYRRADDDHVVLLTMHHIISDGWSTAVLLGEWAEHYDALQTGREAQLPPLEIEYGDFAVWQRKKLRGESLRRELAYWEEQLQGAPAVTDLPLDYPRANIQDFDGGRLSLSIDAALGKRIHQLARQAAATPFMVLMAGYAALLSRFTRQDDFCIGTVTANRREPALERMIGFFVNTLVCRCRTSSKMTFRELVDQVRSTFTSALKHQDLPFEELVTSLAPGHDRSHSPLFQTAMVVQDMPDLATAAGSLSVSPLPFDHGTAKHDLTWVLFPEGDGFVGHIEYRRRLFEQATVERLSRAWIQLLSEASENPQTPIGQLAIVPAADRVTLTDWCHNPIADGSRSANISIPAEIDHWAQPADPAIVDESESTPVTSHEDFQKQSIRMARSIRNRLTSTSAENPPRILVCLPRSADLLRTMFGIWRAGAVYVPVDPQAPAERRKWLESDCMPALVVAGSENADAWSASVVTPAELLEGSHAETLPAVAPDQLAYIIYTSGSTGQPKGVEVRHQNLVHFLRGHAERMQVDRSSRVLHSLSPSFDGGLSEPLLGLSRGGCVVIASAEQSLDPTALTALISRQRVNVAKFPPPKLALLDPAATPSLQTVSSGGDTLTGELAKRWLEAGRRMLNGYGPTEATVGCCMHELKLPVDAKPPIGTPMAGQAVFVVDGEGRLAPIGVAGEIWVGGSGVAIGYRNLPAETAERFVHASDFPDLQPIIDGRLYRTGDLGRWRWDGVLEFLGRMDQQVKIRGYRIEPAEVAATLEQHPDVKQAVVTVDALHGGRLIAYVAPPDNEFRLAEESRGHVDAWQALFEQTHRAAPLALDPEFNIAGWIDSFTGTPIPAEEMREWADQAAERILRFQPKRVLEVGCGTGLILHRVAPHVESFVGVDFLRSSLDQVEQALERRDDRGHVRVLERRADELHDLLNQEHFDDGFEPQPFDMVVLNSVIQYFPNLDYLLQVLDGLVPLLAPDAIVFLGDVRNLELHEALAAGIEWSRAEDDDTLDELRRRVAARIAHEEELLVSPELFYRIKPHLPRLAAVDCWLKEGAAVNELVRFRYDVVLRFGAADSAALSDLPQVNGPEGEAGWNDLAELLDVGQSQAGDFVACGWTNRNVASEQWLWERLNDRQKLPGDVTVASLRDGWRQARVGWTPAELAAAGAKLNFQTTVRWGSQPDRIDVVCRSDGSGSLSESLSGSLSGSLLEFANQPLRDKVASRLTPQLIEFSRQKLPDYMTPSAIVVLSELPRTLQGKVDHAALPPPPAGRPTGSEAEPAANEEEQLVIDVWESLLGTQPIGATDNFFDIGGHSLLAVRVMGAISERTGKRIPLAAFFHDPTPRKLAEALRNPDAGALMDVLAPLNDAGKSLLRGQYRGDHQPLFLVHPAGGTVFCYLALASRLELPVVGIQAVGIDGQRPPHETMEEMAEHYVRAVRSAVSEEACHLGGWSLGGNVAYEVARRLKADGAKVGQVVLLDAGAVPGEESLEEADFLALIMALFPGEEHLSLESLQALPPKEQMEYFADRARRAGLIPPDDEQGGRHVYDVFQKNIKVIHQHRTLPYAGPVSLIRPREQAKTGELFDDPLLGWSEWTVVEKLETSGDHARMVQEPHVEQLATLVMKAIGVANDDNNSDDQTDDS